MTQAYNVMYINNKHMILDAHNVTI